MRYPFNRFKEDWNITAGYRYGAVTEYGRHEGDDLNKNGGGDIELGDPILQIANGDMVYWHKGKHPNTGFGNHSVSKIVGSWGTRWVHNAHMQDDFVTAGPVKEGQQIGMVGKSGTVYAHDHFAIFKVDPATLRNGIDTVAKNEQELKEWWEDPITFIEKYMNISQGGVSMNDQKKATQFDRILIYLKGKNVINSDRSEEFVEGNRLVGVIQALKEDRDNQAVRAGRYDEICNKLGFKQASSEITPEQIIEKMGDQKYYKALKNIQAIANANI